MSVVTEHIKTINQLLEHSGYPVSWVQGHHTRITKSPEGNFQVLIQSVNSQMAYTLVLYSGKIEEEAVKKFIFSEEN